MTRCLYLVFLHPAPRYFAELVRAVGFDDDALYVQYEMWCPPQWVVKSGMSSMGVAGSRGRAAADGRDTHLLNILIYIYIYIYTYI